MSSLVISNRTSAILKKGRALHRAGHTRKASELYSEILTIDPGHADALHLLGLLARQSGELNESESLIRRAIVSSPSVALYHRDLAQTCKLLGKLHETIESYRTAIVLEPHDLDTVQQLANLLFDTGDLAAAASLYESVLERNPHALEVLYNLGRLRRRSGQLDAAILCYRRAASQRPSSPDIHFNLAAALFDSRHFAEAILSYQQVIALQPQDAEAHYSLGVALQETGDFQAAADCYHRALALKPSFPDALSNLGSVTMELGDLDAAEDHLRRCLSLAPQNVNAHCNLGSVLQKKGETLAAIDCFRSALTIDPRHVSTLCNFGTVLDLLGESEGAAQCYRAALAFEPTCDLARFSLSTHLLASGDLANGWREYEARWGTREFRPALRTFTQPQWRGEDIRGARLFVYAEQGFGDTLQFVRFVSMVADRGADIILQVQPSLLRLLRNLHPSVQVIPSGDSVDPATFDWQCPLLSLPLALGIELSNLPASVPYLFPEPGEVESWRERLTASGLRIGLVWCGNPKHTRDTQRSISLDQLLALSGLTNATFYGLQKGPAAEQCATAPTGTPLVNLDEHLKDFADTAAVIANLDLLITVDTAVAHLAAAMGKPVWILIHNAPDWRWLRNRSDSPWYSTVRLFRQKTAGNWNEVFLEVQQALQAL